MQTPQRARHMLRGRGEARGEVVVAALVQGVLQSLIEDIVQGAGAGPRLRWDGWVARWGGRRRGGLDVVI